MPVGIYIYNILIYIYGVYIYMVCIYIYRGSIVLVNRLHPLGPTIK